MSANLENSAVAMGLDKVSFQSSPREGQCQRMFKLPYNWVYTKSFMLGFKSVGTKNIQMCKLNFKGAEELEIKLPTFTGSWRKQRSSIKTCPSASLTMLKPLTVWITQTGKFLKRREYHSNLPVSWEMCIQDKKVVRTEHWRAGWFTTGKGIQQDHILAPCLFHFYAECIMGNARMDESKLESRLPWEISATLDMWWYYYNVRKQRGTKESLDERKSWLET